tara:strand:- start:270 stop:446 length:177 start_codon:yes stop_codon:yes gene_type:complete
MRTAIKPKPIVIAILFIALGTLKLLRSVVIADQFSLRMVRPYPEALRPVRRFAYSKRG